LQRHAVECEETGGFVGELGRRETCDLPQLHMTIVGALPGSIGRPIDRREMLVLTKVVHELQGRVVGHSSFPVTLFPIGSHRSARIIRRILAVSRAVIDPKCDSCAKSRFLYRSRNLEGRKIVEQFSARFTALAPDAMRRFQATIMSPIYFCHIRSLIVAGDGDRSSETITNIIRTERRTSCNAYAHWTATG
jgi:hypothetical protein